MTNERPWYLRAPKEQEKRESHEILVIVLCALALGVSVLFLDIVRAHAAHAADSRYAGVTDGSTVTSMEDFCALARETHKRAGKPLTGDLEKYCGQ